MSPCPNLVRNTCVVSLTDLLLSSGAFFRAIVCSVHLCSCSACGLCAPHYLLLMRATTWLLQMDDFVPRWWCRLRIFCFLWRGECFAVLLAHESCCAVLCCAVLRCVLVGWWAGLCYALLGCAVLRCPDFHDHMFACRLADPSKPFHSREQDRHCVAYWKPRVEHAARFGGTAFTPPVTTSDTPPSFFNSSVGMGLTLTEVWVRVAAGKASVHSGDALCERVLCATSPHQGGSLVGPLVRAQRLRLAMDRLEAWILPRAPVRWALAPFVHRFAERLLRALAADPPPQPAAPLLLLRHRQHANARTLELRDLAAAMLGNETG